MRESFLPIKSLIKAHIKHNSVHKMSPLTSTIFFFILFIIMTTTIQSKPDSFIKTRKKATTKSDLGQEKISHLHFYFHDTVSGNNATAVPITKPAAPNNSSSPFSAFGMITMMDDMLTVGPEPDSPCIGRAQGMYACAALQELGFLQAMNLYFTAGKYNGSVLTVLGRNAPMNPVREMAVVGGSGLFRFARGFVLMKTHWIDFGTGDAVVEYNVTVLHY